MSGLSFSRSCWSKRPPLRKGTLPKERGQVGCTLGFGLSETLVEQAQEEESVELLEPPVAALLLHHL